MTTRTAAADHRADRMPSEDEEAAAQQARDELSDTEDEVARHYEDMARRGVEQQGEGRID